MAVGHRAGRAVRIGIEHHYPVAHAAGLQGEHPAQLSPSHDADRGAGKDHEGSGSFRSSTRRSWRAAKFIQPLAQLRIVESQDGHGVEAGIAGAGVADGEGGDRYAGGHLHDREQRVEALEVFGGNRDAEHRKGGLGGEHARQVGGATGAGDDAA